MGYFIPRKALSTSTISSEKRLQVPLRRMRASHPAELIKKMLKLNKLLEI